MNDYPKDAMMMAEIDEIEGNSEQKRAARRARRARRGKQIAFVRTFQVGAPQVTLTAGDHNKKVHGNVHAAGDVAHQDIRGESPGWQCGVP
ncbi:MAG: hypothetical protein SGPRY_004502 [Prymnesium sp.]